MLKLVVTVPLPNAQTGARSANHGSKEGISIRQLSFQNKKPQPF